MNDLISRAALLDEFHALCGPQTGDGWDNMGVYNLIVRQKAVDAVEVVRCRDCKYAHMTYDGEVKYCDRISMADEDGDYGYALYLPGDWYCADGERRCNDGK